MHYFAPEPAVRDAPVRHCAENSDAYDQQQCSDASHHVLVRQCILHREKAREKVNNKIYRHCVYKSYANCRLWAFTRDSSTRKSSAPDH